jgi:hypothetical protein
MGTKAGNDRHASRKKRGINRERSSEEKTTAAA